MRRTLFDVPHQGVLDAAAVGDEEALSAAAKALGYSTEPPPCDVWRICDVWGSAKAWAYECHRLADALKGVGGVDADTIQRAELRVRLARGELLRAARKYRESRAK